MKNKIIISIMLVAWWSFNAFGQSLNPELIGSSGNQTNSASYQTAWSIGEVLTETGASTSYILNAGFHQNFYVNQVSESDNCLSFNGTSQKVTTPTTITGSYTKQAWINLNAYKSAANIISSTSSQKTALYLVNGTIKAGHNGSWLLVANASQTPLNTWTHVALTYDLPTTTMKLYVNGAKVAENNSVADYDSDVLEIGAFLNESYFNGKIDEVSIWSRALSACEIATNMSNTLTGEETGLLSYYNFNQTSGTTLTDFAGTNNGTLVNSPVWTISNNDLITSNPDLAVSTTGSSFLLTTSATVSGNIITGTATEYGVVYNTTGCPNVEDDTKVTSSNLSSGNFSATLIGLNAETTYSARAYATNNNGTVYGAEISFTTKTYGSGNALAFDVTKDVASAITPSTQLDNISFEAWVYWKGISALNNMIFLNGINTGRGYGLGVAGNTNAIKFLLPGKSWYNTNTTMPENTWTHVALVRRNGTWFFYLNGVETNTGIAAAPYSILSTDLFYLGSNPINFIWNGMIDEASLWNVALTQTEIQNSINQHISGSETGLVSYYKCDQGTPAGDNTAITQLFDYKGNCNLNLTNFDLTDGNTNSNFVNSYAGLPILDATNATNITATSANVDCNITSISGSNATVRGFCYSTSANPTTGDSKVEEIGSFGAGVFTANLTNLAESTHYYVRAYATNTNGTVYGTETDFTTPPSCTAPAISGVTPVNPTKIIGESVTFEVTATGTDLNYQWKKDNANIDNATSYTLTLSNLQTTDAGSYTCYIENACGNQTSTATVLVVRTAIAQFPYFEGFENGATIKFTQSTSDDFDWTRKWKGGTPTGSTGPDWAHTGNAYFYTEADENLNNTATLVSPIFDLTAQTDASLVFWYHMNGYSSMGTLQVQISTDLGTTWTTAWTKSGPQGTEWLRAAVNLPVNNYVMFKFNGIIGINNSSDIGIDDIWVGNLVNTCLSNISTFPYNEGFEAGLGLFVQSQNDDMSWTRKSGTTPSTGTGPLAAFEGNYYMFTETNGNNSKTARLVTPCFDVAAMTNPQLTFAYNMYSIYTSNMGTLNVKLSTDSGQTWTTILTRSGNQGQEWCVVSYDLNSYATNVKLMFEGILPATGYLSDMAIDGIKIAEADVLCNSTITLTSNYAESFENGLGGWAQNQTDDFDWTRNTGATPSGQTGPDVAQNGSYYLFTEGSAPNFPNKVAILESPCFDLRNFEGSPELKFFYHLFDGGNDSQLMGNLVVDYKTLSGSWINILNESGDHGNVWNLETQALPKDVVKLRFTMTTAGYCSDAAIDNVTITSVAKDATAVSNNTLSEQAQFTLYPNPNDGKFTISVNNAEGFTFAVKDLAGRILKTQNIQNNTVTVDLSDYSSGIYFVAVTANGKIQTQKIVVK